MRQSSEIAGLCLLCKCEYVDTFSGTPRESQSGLAKVECMPESSGLPLRLTSSTRPNNA